MARMVLEVYQFSCGCLIGVSVSSFSWVFAHMENNELMPHCSKLVMVVFFFSSVMKAIILQLSMVQFEPNRTTKPCLNGLNGSVRFGSVRFRFRFSFF